MAKGKKGNESGGKAPSRDKRGGQSTLLAKQAQAFLLATLLLLALYLLFKGPGTNKSENAGIARFSSKYCALLRPSGWKGGLVGNTFVFTDAEDGFTVGINQFEAERVVFEPLRTDRDFARRVIENQSRELDVELGKVDIIDVSTDMFDFIFPEIEVHFKTKVYHGEMKMFYSHDVRFIYLATWKNDTPHNRYIARVFLDYLSLKPPYDVPLYARPIVKNDECVDSAALLAKAGREIQAAKALWKNADEAPDNVQRAMENLQNAMKLVARSEMDAAFVKKNSGIVEIYKKCHAYRQARLDRMKSEIMQAEALGNKSLAKEIAKELLEVASLDGEGRIRAWAKKQIGDGQED